MKRIKYRKSTGSEIPFFAIKVLFLLIIMFALSSCSDEKAGSIEYDTPYNLEISKTSDGQIQLTWQYSSQSADVIYVIARKEGAEDWNENYYQTTNDQRVFIDNIPTNSFTIYSYKVKAKETETGSESFFSNPVSFFPEISKPSDLQVQQYSQNQLKISWTDNIEGEAGYKIDRKTNNNNWSIAYAVLDENSDSYIDIIDQQYQSISYRVYAFVGNTNSPANEVTFTPSVQVPDSLALDQISSSQIKVSWNYVGDSPDIFDLQRKIGTNDWANLAQVNGNLKHYIDNLSIESATLAYRIRSKKDTLYSNYSMPKNINFNIVELSTINLQNSGNQLFVKDNYLFIANDYHGTLIYNVENPTSPSLIKNINMPGRTLSLAVYDNTLYLANDQGLMHVYDISDIGNPVKLYDDIQFYGQGNHINIGMIDGKRYAFVAAGSSGLKIIALDMPNMPQPIVIKAISTVPGAHCFKSIISENSIYIAEGTNGVRQFNISDPYSPTLINHKTNIGTIVDISLSQHYLYVARGDRGIALLNKTNFDLISDYDTQGYSNSLAIDSRNIYISDRDEGFLIVSAVNPLALYSLCKLETTSYVLSVFVQNKYAYICTQSSCKIIQIRP